MPPKGMECNPFMYLPAAQQGGKAQPLKRFHARADMHVFCRV